VPSAGELEERDLAAVGERPSAVPFDRDRLESAMREAGIDVIVASSRHSVRYLLGGYRHHYYANDEALGLSRYQPLVGYVAGSPEEAFFIGSWMDSDPQRLSPIWTPERRNTSTDGGVTATLLLDALRARGLEAATIGVEPPFLSVEIYRPLAEALGRARFADAVPALEFLRAVKRPDELRLMRAASEGVVDSIRAVFARTCEGDSSCDIDARMAEEQRRRGLEFSFTFVALGTDRNRTPSTRRLAAGMTASVDSAGKLDGYIGDLARMGVVGGPTAEMIDALEAVDAVQMAARAPMRAGAVASSIYDAADAARAELAWGDELDFVAHGIGMVSHEAPRLAAGAENPHRYPAAHRDLPLEAGMVVSIETTMPSERLGYIKLEDTVAVTATGCEGYGDGARGWNAIEVGTGTRH
jgi:Xaa-Pro aminopeptidase